MSKSKQRRNRRIAAMQRRHTVQRAWNDDHADRWRRMPEIELAWELVDAMLRHMIEGRPNEVCGLIAAKDGSNTPVAYRRVVCDDPSPASYHMDPISQMEQLTSIRSAGQYVWGIFHSHPGGWAYPSTVDTSQATWPEVHYLIGAARGPRLRAYRFVGDKRQVEEDELIVRYLTVAELERAEQERQAKQMSPTDLKLEDIGLIRMQGVDRTVYGVLESPHPAYNEEFLPFD